MAWLRRVFTDTEDDGRYRSGLGMLAGAAIPPLPLLFDVLDRDTVVIATLVGAVVAGPLLFFGETLPRPLAAAIPYLSSVILMLIVVRELPYLAFFVFVGGSVFTLSALRFLTGWRNPVPAAPTSELPLGPVRPGLVLVLVLPMLALVLVIVAAIANGSRPFG